MTSFSVAEKYRNNKDSLTGESSFPLVHIRDHDVITINKYQDFMHDLVQLATCINYVECS